MKKFVLTALSCLVFFGLQAQVTITSSNYVYAPGYKELRNIDTAGIMVPKADTNMAYDYSSLKGDSTKTIPFDTAKDSKFPTAIRFSYGLAVVGGIPLISKYYTTMNSNGVFRLGGSVIPESIGIGSITGGSNDTITFPQSYSIFANTVPLLKFPMTYGNTWSANFTFTTNFVLTVQAFGLNHTPGKEIQHASATDSVVGWGTLKIPSMHGASIPYDVLLVKSSEMVQDSFFLGGSPAPASLLGAFGVTQGEISYVNRYRFYTPNHDGPILELKMNDDFSKSYESYYPSNDIVSGVNEVMNQLHFKVFPNPLNGQKLNISLDKTSAANWRMALTNVLGQTVSSKTLAGQGNLNVSLNLGENIPNGIYLLNIVNENGEIITHSKVDVNR